MFIQSPLHRLDPLFQSIVQFALFLMILLILLKRSLVRTSFIETSHLHLVYQTFPHQIFLDGRNFLFAGYAFSFQRDAEGAESVAARMDPLRILHQGFADRAIKKLGVCLVD